MRDFERLIWLIGSLVVSILLPLYGGLPILFAPLCFATCCLVLGST